VTAYSESKQAEIFFTYELAKRLKGNGVMANCFCPGLVKTNLARSDKGLSAIIRPFITTLLSFTFTSMETAVRIGMFLAVSRKAEGLNGRYLVRNKDRVIFNINTDNETTAKLWALCDKMTKAKPGE
jgi:NAD(P)-dependent dehydrogenase (short-subunit alcohol dehydrogenase family)